MRFHISPKTGEAKICKADVQLCPFGENMPHFDSKQQAQQYFEVIMQEKQKKQCRERIIKCIDDG